MNLKFVLGVLELALVCATGPRAEAEPRIALLIGNAHYSQKLGALATPADDAQLMAETLKKIGFSVIVVLDADQKQMKRAIVQFGELLEKGGPLATGLFFFSGHGMSVKGRSFLIPLGAQIAREVDLSIESLTVDDIVEQMTFAGNATNFIVIDWSHASSLSKSFRSASDPVQVGLTWPGFLLAYSGAPGLDTSGGARSPYVTALAEALTVPGLSIHEVFDRVRKKVVTQTEGRQLPWEAALMTDPFYFLPKN